MVLTAATYAAAASAHARREVTVLLLVTLSGKWSPGRSLPSLGQLIYASPAWNPDTEWVRKDARSEKYSAELRTASDDTIQLFTELQRLNAQPIQSTLRRKNENDSRRTNCLRASGG